MTDDWVTACTSGACVEVQWVTYCSNGNACIEAGAGDGVVLIRDNETPDLIITVSPDSWHTFVAGVKAGVFDQVVD